MGSKSFKFFRITSFVVIILGTVFSMQNCDVAKLGLNAVGGSGDRLFSFGATTFGLPGSMGASTNGGGTPPSITETENGNGYGGIASSYQGTYAAGSEECPDKKAQFLVDYSATGAAKLVRDNCMPIPPKDVSNRILLMGKYFILESRLYNRLGGTEEYFYSCDSNMSETQAGDIKKLVRVESFKNQGKLLGRVVEGTYVNDGSRLKLIEVLSSEKFVARLSGGYFTAEDLPGDNFLKEDVSKVLFNGQAILNSNLIMTNLADGKTSVVSHQNLNMRCYRP